MQLPRDTNERRQLAMLLWYLHKEHGWTWSALAKRLGKYQYELNALRRIKVNQ